MKRRVFIKILSVIIIFLTIIILKNINSNATIGNNNPMLKGIKINGEDIEPKFEMFTTEYVTTVDNETNQANIKAIPDDANAKVEVIGNEDLREGRNEFEIKVTAEDGETKQSYFVYITKGDSQKANANLKSLNIEEGEFAPLFEKNTIDYALEYPENLQKLSINAIAEDENAKVEIIGNENLQNKYQKIEIKVTAEDQQTVKKYYIVAKKISKDTNRENNEEEEEENIKEQLEKLENNEIKNDETKYENEESKKQKFSILIVIIIGILSIFIFIKRKNKEIK